MSFLESGSENISLIPLEVDGTQTNNDTDNLIQSRKAKKEYPGDNPKNALDLGKVGDDPIKYNDDIGITESDTKDNSDFYKFTLTQELNNVYIVLDSLKANANITLFDENKGIIDQSRQKGTKEEIIDQVLEAGTYYLEVEPQGTAKTKYQLSLDADKFNDDPDGTLALAQKIEIGEEAEDITDKIGFEEDGQRDQRDYYQFTLDQESEVNITLDGLKRNANLGLLDDLGGTLFTSTEKGKKLDKITTILESGTYHVLVQPFSSDQISTTLASILKMKLKTKTVNFQVQT